MPQVARWGNSLAVRLPVALAQELGLQEGDQVSLIAADRDQIAVHRDRRRQEAVEMMERLARPLPPGYKFDREEANAR